MPRRPERAHEAVEQLPRTRLDERACALNVRGGDERVDGGGAERSVDLLVDRDPHSSLDVRAQLRERVELARGPRQLVVDLGQHLLVDVLDGDRDGWRPSRRRARSETSLVSPTLAPTRAASISSTSRPEPSSTTVSDCASPAGLCRSTTSVSPSLAGRSSAGTSSATVWRKRLELLVDELLRHLGLGARNLERRPVDDLGRRLHLDRGRERPALLVGRRQLEVELRGRHRTQSRARRRRPEPAADVGVHGLGPDPVPADLGDEHRRRHLPLAEPGDLDRLGEVVRRVLDCVLQLVR